MSKSGEFQFTSLNPYNQEFQQIIAKNTVRVLIKRDYRQTHLNTVSRWRLLRRRFNPLYLVYILDSSRSSDFGSDGK